MLTLVTTNPSKYAAFRSELERLRVEVVPPPSPVPELQSLSFAEALAAKANALADVFGRPVLVDDAGLILEAYKPFPGPLTSNVVGSLGSAGLGRLLTGVSTAALMECHLGCWLEGQLRSWSGTVAGHIDTSRRPRDPRMPLSDLFVPDVPAEGSFLHRARAVAAFAADAFDLHLRLSPEGQRYEPDCPFPAGYQCPFCIELEGEGQSLFEELVQGRLSSRILYQDDHFIVMPPLGQFIEGGLLLLTRSHIPSFAHLPPAQFAPLEKLLGSIQKVSIAHWGVSPLVFEHGSAFERSKGKCCVDHAHFNIFPANVRVHLHLAGRMHRRISSLAELSRFRGAEFGYLFVRENDGTCCTYDAQHVPTQLVRRIITSEIGLPERWHWRDYAGVDELVATYKTLQGQIHL